jgi:pSer/pThr/pTyr-binding forkhead associated (FHA) protein
MVKIGSGAVKRYDFDRDAIVIGRSETVDIRIDDPAVSRVHCQVTRTPSGRWILQDFGSRNKTYLGDEPVGRHELINGDTFHVGPARIVFSGAPGDPAKLLGDATTGVGDAVPDTEAWSSLDDDEVAISDDLAELASGEMTMIPDDPLHALAEDSRRSGIEEDTSCPMCGGKRLPGDKFCGPCQRRLDAQQQSLRVHRSEEPKSLWKRLFGGG